MLAVAEIKRFSTNYYITITKVLNRHRYYFLHLRPLDGSSSDPTLSFELSLSERVFGNRMYASEIGRLPPTHRVLTMMPGESRLLWSSPMRLRE
jgi:hypothetical protein